MSQPSESRGLFRQESLSRYSTPDRLDHLMEVVSVGDWLPLLGIGVLIAVASIWSVIGRVPVDVEGRGALIYPPRSAGEAPVEEFAAPTTGVVTEVRVSRGDRVTRGQVLGLIDLPETRKTLELQREKLRQLEAQRLTIRKAQSDKSVLETQAMDVQQRNLENRIASARRLGRHLLDKQLAAVMAQRSGAYERLLERDKLLKNLHVAVEKRRALRAEGLVSEAALLESERAYADAAAQVEDLEARLRDTHTREAEIRKDHLENESAVADLEAQQRELAIKAKGVAFDLLQDAAAKENEIQEVRRQIANLVHQLGTQGTIRAKSAGQVLEINALIGQAVTQGSRLGALEVASSTPGSLARNRHIGLGYFTVGDGKRIRPGMRAQVTPDSVRREEMGGIIGTVTRVSEFPVSPQAAANLVNNSAIAQVLTDGGRVIEVFVELEPDSFAPTGFKWTSSKGPAKRIVGTTTASLRVTLEDRAPISFVLPILRSMSGVQ